MVKSALPSQYRALTVRNPFAWAIAHAGKTVENRGLSAQSWGPIRNLFIHAGAAWSMRGAADHRIRQPWFESGLPLDELHRTTGVIAFRSIVAVVDLVGVHIDQGCCRPWGESTYRHADGESVTTVTHLQFENVRALEHPIPYTLGRLGLWVLPESVAVASLEQV